MNLIILAKVITVNKLRPLSNNLEVMLKCKELPKGPHGVKIWKDVPFASL